MLFKRISFYLPLQACNHDDEFIHPVTEKLKIINPNINLLKTPSDGLEAYETASKLKDSTFVMIWNGSEPGAFWAKELCIAFDVPYLIVERGLFPQENHYILDREGICCRSHSLGKPAYRKKAIKPNLDRVAFIMQLEFDTTVYHYSNFRNNEEFVDHYVNELGIDQESVIICPHPRNPDPRTKYLVSKKTTMEETKDCTLAIGISSTVLYEISASGTPVIVTGDHKNSPHPINRHENIENLIDMIKNNQFSTNTTSEELKSLIKKMLTN